MIWYAELFGHYKDFSCGANILTAKNKKRFVKVHPIPEVREFLQWFVESGIFQAFLYTPVMASLYWFNIDIAPAINIFVHININAHFFRETLNMLTKLYRDSMKSSLNTLLHCEAKVQETKPELLSGDYFIDKSSK